MERGQALYEEMVVKGDRVINPNLDEYRIPTMMDRPVLYKEIVDSYDPDSPPLGAKESGEGLIYTGVFGRL